MALTTQDKILIEARIANDGPSVTAAYLLWFFLGFISAHRFYLGRPGTALLQIVSYFFIVGVIWWIVDAFLIPGMIRGKQDDLRQRYLTSALANDTST